MKYLLLFFFFSHTLLAQTPKELAQLARIRAPQILMSLQEARARSLGVEQATLWQNPSLTMQSGRARTAGDFAFVMDLTLMQSVPWPGTRSVMKEGATYLQEIAQLDLQEAGLRLYHATLLLSIELAHFEKLSEEKQSRKKRLGEVKKFLEAKTYASVNDKIERDMILNQILLIENEHYEIDSKINLLRSKLKRLTGLTGLKKVELSYAPLKLVSRAELLKELSLSPEWKRQAKFMAIAQNEVKKAKLATHPEFQVGLNYRIEHLNPENEFIHANLGVTLPLWDRGQYREEIARAGVLREEANKKLVEMNLANLFDELYASLELSYRQSQKFPIKNLKGINQRIKEVDQAFRKGRIPVSALLQVDNLTYETMNLIFKSHYDYYKNLAGLHDLLGKQMDF